MGIRLSWAPLAKNDLDNIESYIAADNPVAASALVAQIAERALRLKDFPEMGSMILDFDDRSVRQSVIGSYRLIYRFSRERMEVEIVRVWHGARGRPTLNKALDL